MSAVINTSTDDIMTGGTGNDTYVWGRASGTDIIIDEGGFDTVHINAAISEISLSAYTDDGSLVIALDGQFLTIRDYFNTVTSGHIEYLTFADGSRWGLAEVEAALAGNTPPPPPPTNQGKVLTGTDADETLTGTDFGDTISGGAGTDLLEGGYGDDVYIWGPGHDVDVVRDYGGADTVLIDATPDQLKFYGSLDYKGYPLIIKLGDEQLAIEGYFSEESFKNGYIEKLVFSDGTVWTKADVLKVLIPVVLPPPPPQSGKVITGTQASEVLTGTEFNDTIDGGGGNDELFGGKGNDTYIWGPQSGSDLILDSGGNDTVLIRAASSNAELFAHFDGTLVISIMGQTLTIRTYLATGENGRHIETIAFSDGVVWDRDKVLEILNSQTPPPPPPSGLHLVGTNSNDTLEGGSGNDTISGGAGDDLILGHKGNDILNGDAGNDLLVADEGDDTLDGGEGADHLDGGAGNDTYLWGPHSGSDFIWDYKGTDTIRINALASEIRLFKAQIDGAPLGILLNGASLTINDYFDQSENGGYIDNIVFADGTVWHMEEVLAALAAQNPPPPPSQDEVLTGSAGDDTLDGGAGNDTLDGAAGDDVLYGGKGNDVYIWGPSSGNDLIQDIDGVDTIRIGAPSSAVTLSAQMDGTLVISLNDQTLTIRNYMATGESGGHIESIVFSDGTVWDLNKVLEILNGQTPPPEGVFITGSAGDDTLQGGDGDDTLDGAAGDDALYGGKGDDVYLWNPGSGNDLILDSGGNDMVRIDAASSAVELFLHLDGTLVISLNGQKLTIRNYLATGDEGRHIEQLVFSDGVSWDRDKVLEILEPQTPPPPTGLHLVGTEGNDTLQGGANDDTIDGSSGDDVLFGGTGNDVYIWGQGKGHDLIDDAGGDDLVKIAAASSDVSLLMHLDGTLVISTNGGSLTIRNYLATSTGGGHVEKLAFSDGAIWNLDKVLEILAAQHPEPNPDPEPDPTSDPEPEGEIIVGQKTNDALTGSFADDTLMGGTGHDTLNGGAGDDILVGGQGRDVLTGGAGADFFVFMKKADLGMGSNRDRITDFEAGVDLIDLGKIDANSSTKKNDAFKTLLKGKAAFTKAGQLHYDAKTGILSGNLDKDAAAEFQILLTNKPKALHLDDFIL